MKTFVNQINLKNSHGDDVFLNIVKKDSSDVIIVAHGFDSSKFGSTFRFLADNIDASVVSFDFPSHGDSSEELLLKNCLYDLALVDSYVRKNFLNCSVSLFGSSFGAYVILNYLSNNNFDYKAIFLKSVAVKMDKIFRDVLIEEDMESFRKRGYTIKARNKKMIIPYAFYEDLVNNQICDLNAIFNKNIYVFHGTSDDTALFSDLDELRLPDVHILKLEDANHLFSDDEFLIVTDKMKKILG